MRGMVHCMGIMSYFGVNHMAKKTDVNKSEEIRKVFAESPKAKAKEVVETLKATGIDVTESLVYAVKKGMKGKKKGKTSKATATPKTHAAPSSNGVLSVGASIATVRECATRVGGMTALKEIVDALQ